MSDDHRASITIDVVSDVVCPWCFVGKRKLEQALALVPELNVELNWRPFQLDPTIPQGGVSRLEYMTKKFGPEKIAAIHERLEGVGAEAGIPFAVAGAVACNAHGHRRATQDVDVLVPRERLRDVAEALSGRGWQPRFAGAKRSWRDSMRGVDVDLLTSGDFPGDGLPKAVAFPFPDADAAVRTALEGVPVLDLVQLVQLKLASAASAPHRGKDAADVRALIAANALPWAFATELDVSVRAQFVALWKEVEAARSAGLA